MHKFIDNIVAFSLKNKFFIFFCTTIAVIAGVVSFKHTPIDAFPDVTNTKVTIITQWAGRSAEEVEKFITIPVEIAMNSVQKKMDCLLYTSSNSSLCGAFNANVLKMFLQTVGEYRELGQDNILIYPVGKKIEEAVKKLGFFPQGSYQKLADKPSYRCV